MRLRLHNPVNRLPARIASLGVASLFWVRAMLLGVSTFGGFALSGIETVNAQPTPEEAGPDVAAPSEPSAKVDAESGNRELRRERRKKDRKHERADRKAFEQGESAPRDKKPDWIRMKRQMLEFSDRYFESVQDPNRALGFAALGIKDYYRRQGKPEQAVPEIEAILEQTTDQKARNVLLFIIRQIHEAEGSDDKFMALNKQIVAENLKQLSAESARNAD